MKIKYLGPGDSVNVPPHGEHQKGTVKEYPDEFGEELLATSKKQKFELVEIDKSKVSGKPKSNAKPNVPVPSGPVGKTKAKDKK